MLLSFARTLILYCAMILSVRLMGKRQIGQLEPSEFVVTMLAANLASVPMQDEGIPLLAGLVPIFTVLGAELALSGLTMASTLVRKMLCGKPVILIDNGNLLEENLRKTRITLDELMGQLREKDVLDISTVQFAILETSGNLSVFPYPKHLPATAKEAGISVKPQYLPVTIVEDGYVSQTNLRLAGKDQNWLNRVLENHHSSPQDTLLLTVDRSDRILWIGKEGKK